MVSTFYAKIFFVKQVIIKTLQNLTDSEIDQLNEASEREFKVSLPPKEKMLDRHFFLLEQRKEVLAMGQLLPVEPIKFNSEEFFVLGIGGIIAKQKGKGYGKAIMAAIKDWLVNRNKTGIGFCKLKNKGFYEKCGFLTNIDLLNRFVYLGTEKFYADSENECIFYMDGNDQFMEKVLNNPDQVVLPIPPVW
ncbi:GNAT family N-acetyltransferase [Candidatus Daviesbacteria bacterium]|nr:GNAT family N-acetyltransferase [Candidatus Daviesbacteria bacterium]